MTQHNDLLDEVVHLVPVAALGQRSCYPIGPNVKQGKILLFDEPLSLFQCDGAMILRRL